MSSLGLRLAASTSRAARAASACVRPSRIQSRALHKRKELPYPIEEGLGNFLPPPALKMIAVDYQDGLLERLNDQVRGTALENKSIVQTIIDAARTPEKVLEFNYACEALNNSFFLNNLKPPSGDALSTPDPTNDLYRRFQYHYGSFAHFQSNFSAAVLGMFSSGWVWLVCDQNGDLGIVPTFGPGTLLVRASQSTKTFTEWQRLVGDAVVSFSEHDLRAPPLPPSAHSTLPPQAGSPLSGVTHSAPEIDPHTPSRSMSRFAAPQNMYNDYDSLVETKEQNKSGQTLYPLLCVSVHEHAWVGAGYGVWGKEEYMKRFWSVVDWSKVEAMYNKAKPATDRPRANAPVKS